MSRVERLLEIMIRVQNKQRFTVQELASEFHVSRRTMLRDLQALSELGMPLLSTPGPHGGYELISERGLLPLSLSVDEAIAILISYEALLQYAESPFAEENLSAVTKIRNALPSHVVDELDRIRSHVAIYTSQRTYCAPLLRELLDASMDQVHLVIRYDSRRGVSERMIYPFGLYASDGFWYCAAFDYKRHLNVSLRADRIVCIVERVEGLKKPPYLSLRDWMNQSSVAECNLGLTATVSADGMKYSDWSLWGNSITLQPDGRGLIEHQILESDLDFYARYFIRMGTEVVVHSPPSLVTRIRERLSSILNQYTSY